MVMHARKFPRLNDGYHDRNQAHPFEGKYPSKSLGSRDGDRYETTQVRESPNYRNKRECSPSRPSPKYRHIDRVKEKGSNNSPGEWKHNHYYNNERSSGRHEREHNNDPKHSAATSKNHKSEFQKSALRVSGDWSEHLSSSGKKYYYNCRTEVSQWEKPKEWLDSSPVKTISDTGRSRDKNGQDGLARSTVTKSHEERYRHSNSVSERSKPSSSQASYSRPGYERVRDPHDHRCHNTDSNPGHREWTSDERSHRKQEDSHLQAHRSQDHAFNGARTSASHNDYGDSQQTEDMDISPDSTPTHMSRHTSRHGTPPSTSTPSSIATTVAAMASLVSQVSGGGLVDPRQHHGVMHPNLSIPTLDNRTLTQQTIETLKKLQEALIAQQAQQQLQQQQQFLHQQKQNPGNSCGAAHLDVITPVLRSSQAAPELAETLNMVIEEEKRHCDKPNPESTHARENHNQGMMGSQGGLSGMGTSALAAAASRKQDCVQLTPSLANHFDEKLIGHVTGWPTEPLERHADHFSEEINGIGCIQCSRVIVELKKARSMVRIAEILSTPKEQRVLFLRQQIKDLENMKGQSSYMSYQDT